MTINVEQTQLSLAELIGRAEAGETVVITRGDKAVAELRPIDVSREQRQFGACKGMLEILSDDDEHLKDFEGYMK